MVHDGSAEARKHYGLYVQIIRELGFSWDRQHVYVWE